MESHRPAHRTSCTLIVGLAAIPLAASQSVAAQTTAIWTGSSSGNYATASNWDIGQVPLNGAGSSYIVQIGSGRAVTYNTIGARAIDQLSLDVNSSFNLTSSSLVQPTNLTVLGTALIAGSISANNASFTAVAAGTSLPGMTTTIGVSNGGVVRIGAGAYSARGITGGTLLGASGAGSLIDLSSVQSINSGSPVTNFAYTNSIIAADRAVIDLFGARTLVAPSFASGALAFNVTSGARLNLGSLQEISGPTIDSGYTNFFADGGNIALGPLQKVNRLNVDLRNASVMTAGGFAGVAAITNSTISVSGGSTFNADSLKATYDARGITGGTLLNVSGNGSLLKLSGLQTIDSGSPATNFAYTNNVNASDKAALDLSGVKNLVAPAFASGALAFNVISGATLNLSSLQEMAGLTLDSGNTRFSADGGSIVLGPVQKANRLAVNLQNASTMTAGGYAGVGTISNSTFAVSSGSKLDGSTWVANFSARGFTGNSLLSASGDGSVLNMSGLQTIDSGSPAANFAYANSIGSADRALINLSGVKTLVAPAFGSGALAFNATSGASINLGSLQEISGLTIDTGYTTFTADGGNITLGPLQKVNRMNVNLQNASAMTAGGFSGLAAITNSTFAVSGGSTLDAAALKATYAAKGFTGGTLMSASGAGSTLNLSGLQTIDSGSPPTNFAYANNINATDKALINLSGVKIISAPAFGAAALNVNASGGARIDLGGLQTVDTSGGGQVNFNAASAGGLAIHGFNAGPGVRINLVDSGSNVAVAGNLNLFNGSTLSAGTGTRLSVTGSFSFEQTAASQMNLERATLSLENGAVHHLEVGGRHLGMLTTAMPVLGNFAIGRLVVGDAAASTFVQLVDAINNGNRSPAEALYLNGDADGSGLAILNGSTLALNGLDLYVNGAGQWTHINDLFSGGATTIAYDNGFITTVPEPATLALLLAGLGFIMLRCQRSHIGRVDA